MEESKGSDYTKNFYEQYCDYLDESTISYAHESVIDMLLRYPNKLLDLGCGQGQEILRYVLPEYYAGIDLNACAHSRSQRNENYVEMLSTCKIFALIKEDYRKADLLEIITPHFLPTAFVSLFSSEITAPFEENYRFYKKVFKELPSIQHGLVSGFYYVSQKGANPIRETGGIVSYQTLETQEEVKNEVFDEIRLSLPVPSKMFGPDVYEIWKLFTRK